VLHLGAAHQDRIEPVRALVEHFDTHVYGENWEKHDIHNRGLVYGEETLKALNSARVVVLFSRTPSGRQTVKVGIFDFLEHYWQRRTSPTCASTSMCRRN
jgi:hypothetical protein